MSDEEKSELIRKLLDFKPVQVDYWVNRRNDEIEIRRKNLLEEAIRIREQGSPTWLRENETRESVKEQLVSALRSGENVTVKQAIYELERRGWLQDGSLQGISLSGADLSGVVLTKAILPNVDLSKSNLRGAYLSDVDLQGAKFSDANLADIIIDTSNMQRANFDKADMHLCWIGNNLEGASLNAANLEDSVFVYSNLSNATFVGANLQTSWFIEPILHGVDFLEANLYKAFFHIPRVDKHIRMPNGTTFNPFSVRDHLHHYTEPDNPKFWRSPEETEEKK